MKDTEASYEKIKEEFGALRKEWLESKILTEINELETQFLEQATANELGVAGAITFGLAVANTTIKAIAPSKAVAPLVGGLWIFGGAFILLRITASTAAGWAAMSQRNDKRKKILIKRLKSIQARIETLHQSFQSEQSPGEEDDTVSVVSLKRPSPTGSSDSSGEIVEAPSPPMEPTSGIESRQQQQEQRTWVVEQEGPSTSSVKDKEKGTLEGWKQYASLGSRKS